MKDQNCGNCKSWIRGQCHKHCPLVLPDMQNSQNAYDPQPIVVTDGFRTMWPETNKDEWCGEFEAKECETKSQ